jgi:hypothetical protein
MTINNLTITEAWKWMSEEGGSYYSWTVLWLQILDNEVTDGKSWNLLANSIGVSGEAELTLHFYQPMTATSEIRGSFLPSVPIPPAILLLGSGLIALAGFRRKFRK